MVKYLLKKSYQQKSLKEIPFKDLWNDRGIFTTMWIKDSPHKIIFYKSHIRNLLSSLKKYKIYKKGLKDKIEKIIRSNIDRKFKYNHLLRIALNKSTISISLRDKLKISRKLNLKLVNYKRIDPEHKNLKYKFILNKMSNLDPKKEDICLCVNDNILETGTSNILFVSKSKIYSPLNKYYRGNNLKFFEKKFKIIKKNIKISDLKFYDEIIIIGSGKGVSSVYKITNYPWKRKNISIYKKMLRVFNLEISNKKYIYI